MNADQPIFGLDKDLDVCDDIFHAFPKSAQIEENGLFRMKWFDYRHLHAVHASYLFADAYRTAYREAFRAHFDVARAEHVKGWKGEDIFDFSRKRNVETTGFIKARQWADALGMPYLEYTRIAIDWAMRRTRQYVPRPTHLYSFDLLTAIQETWRERQAGRVYVASEPLFRNGAYQALPVQDAHHEWLLQQAALRANAAPYLARVLYDEDALLESKVEARFGRDVLDRARQLHA